MKGDQRLLAASPCKLIRGRSGPTLHERDADSLRVWVGPFGAAQTIDMIGVGGLAPTGMGIYWKHDVGGTALHDGVGARLHLGLHVRLKCNAAHPLLWLLPPFWALWLFKRPNDLIGD